MDEKEKALFEKAILFLYRSALEDSGCTAELWPVWLDDNQRNEGKAGA